MGERKADYKAGGVLSAHDRHEWRELGEHIRELVDYHGSAWAARRLLLLTLEVAILREAMSGAGVAVPEQAQMAQALASEVAG